MTDWVKVVAPNGRPYYFDRNNKSNVTWERPDDYVEPDPQQAQQAHQAQQAQQAQQSQQAQQQAIQKPAHPQEDLDNAWKATKNAEGKTYYWNSLSRQTTWDLPHHLAQKAQAYLPQAAAPAQAAAAGAGYNQGAHPQQRPQDEIRATNGNAMVPWGQKQEGADYNRLAAPAKIYDADFGSYEEAEAAFFQLLEDNEVTSAMPIADVLKTIAKDPVYRGIKDPADRQTIIKKYQHDLKEKQVSQERERKTKLKADFQKMLTKHTDIVHYTRWKTAVKKLEHEPAFQAIDNDAERRQIFEEHIVELILRHHEEKTKKKEAGMRAMEDMLKDMVIDPETTWSETQQNLEQDQRFINSPHIINLQKADVLTAFEHHMVGLEEAAHTKRQQEKKVQARRARKARDSFIGLLKNMRAEGLIKPYMYFAEFLKLVADDERYTALLGEKGSTPMDFFRDVVQDVTAQFRLKKNEAMDILEDEGFEVKTSTTIDEFTHVLRRARRRPHHFTIEEIPAIFEGVMAKVKERAEKERKEAEKSHRHAYDDFKRDLARMRGIPAGTSYEDILPKLTQLESFQHLDEEIAKKAYSKYMRRAEEEDRERRNERRRDHDSHRSHRRTRTPEADAYEAERRKAQEARERQHRNTSTGLGSPSRGMRRSMGREYSGMERGGGRYGSRADPRDKMNRALDYGDEDAVGSGPGSAVKRRGSQVSERATKVSLVAPYLTVLVNTNLYIQRPRTTTPATKEPSPSYRSGSEEGELAEG